MVIPPIRDVVFACCRLHLCVTISSFLESLNLGYNKKRVVESFGECWRIVVAKLDPKRKKLLLQVTSLNLNCI
jgi:hypothetical protein